MTFPTRFTATSLLMFLLAACGQSGPLYIPGNPSSVQPQEQQADSDEAADEDEEDRDERDAP